MPYKLTFEDGSDGYLAQTELDPKEVERRRYAFPEERKFPLTDASKVMSAIKFFNYVDPKDERHLAEAILKRMEELGISEVNVGPTNRFKKYYEAQDGYLQHFGVKGMHWGVWNEETRARRLGYKEINKIAKSSTSYSDAKKQMKQILGNPISEETKQADAKLSEALDALDDYYKKIGVRDPEEHPVYIKAADKAAKDYIKMELKQNGSHYPEGSRARVKLEEFAYIEVGDSAGKKAFNAKFPDYRKLENAYDRAWKNYSDSLKKDVDRLVDANADKRLEAPYSNVRAKTLVEDTLFDIALEERRRS